MAQQNWWEQDEVYTPPARTQTLPERKMGADITQSGASAEQATASAEKTRTLLPYDIKQAEATTAKTTAEAEKAAREAKDAADKAAGRQTTAVRSFQTVLDKIDQVALDAADNGGWGETGTTGSLMRKYGPEGTAATDLAKNIKTIDANSAFAALQQMRDNSPTGGALGSITENELELLKSTIANIDPNLSQGEFLKNLAEAKKHYLQSLSAIDPEAAAAYDKKPGIRSKDDGTYALVYNPDDSEEAAGLSNAGPTPPNAGGPGGSGGGGVGPAPNAPTDDSAEGLLRGLGMGAGSIAEGVGDTIGLLGGNALGTLAYRAAGYDKPYDMGDALRNLIGLPKNTTGTDAAIQGGTMAMTGAGAGRGIASLLQPGAMKSSLGILGATPIRDAVAGAGAAGASKLAEDSGVGTAGQIAAGLAGGATGYGGASMLNLEKMLAGKAATPLAEIAARQGVDLSAADVGGPATRILTSAAKASPISAGPIVKAAQRGNEGLRDAVSRIAASQGDVPTTDVAGESIQQAAKRLSAQTRDIGNTNYTRAFEEAGPLQIPATNAIGKIDDMLSKLSGAPDTNASTIAELNRIKGDLQRGLTAEQIHELRSNISGGVFDGKLRSSKDQGRMKAVRAALTDDMLGYLKSTGLTRAANRIEKADKYWADRVEHIDQVLQPIVGQEGTKSGEQVIQTIESMTRGANGGNKRLSRLLSNMSGDERGEVTATIIDRLGKATAGQQDDVGSAFSPSTFLTNWNKMTPQAKATVFRDPALRRNLDDVAALADGMRGTQKLANHSNTGAALAGNVGAQAIWAATHLPSYLAGAGAQYLTGRMLASPKFTRWLARAPKYEDPRKAVDALGVIAAREPALQGDIAAFQQHLTQSLAKSPGGASAEEERD